ncbi:MAG: acyltransferase, partial [Actinomycetota bacterium]|nr:acyltransferase [Actinomycetota bacterium]
VHGPPSAERPRWTFVEGVLTNQAERRPAQVGDVPAIARYRRVRSELTRPHGEAGHGLTHEPGIDGLRGLAVVTVMLYHFEPGWLPGGFLGVDTFMVLSGFLITRLLLAEWDRGAGIGLRRFWGRRARRLLPALFLVLAAVAAVSVAWLPANQYRSLRGDAWAAITYVSNWHLIATNQSYVATAGVPSPLRHMWSLAIEEQYYVVWPLVVMACLRVRRHGRTLLAVACGLGIALSALAMVLAYRGTDPSRAYYGTDSRAQTLLVGAGLALLLHGRTVPILRWFVGVAAAVLAAQAFLWFTVSPSDGWLYHGGFLAYALTTAVLVVAALGTGPLARPFSWAPARLVGRVSYGLYLWHWPIVVFLTPVRTGLDGVALLMLRAAVTAVAAGASYTLVEQPIRRRRWADRSVRILGPTSAVAVAAVFALVAVGAKPLPRYLRSNSGASATKRTAEVVAPKAVTRTTVTAAGAEPVVLPKVAVLQGDSVAASLEDALADELSSRGVLTVKSAVNGCGMITGSPIAPDGRPYSFGPACSSEIPAREISDVVKYQANLVVWVSSWEARDRDIDGQRADLGTPAGDQAILTLMRKAVERLTVKGARVIVVTLPVPYDTATVIHPAGLIDNVPKMNALLRRLAASDPDHVGLVDLDKLVCGPAGTAACPHVRDGVEIRADGLHYSEQGARQLAPAMVNALLAPDQWRVRR